MQGIKRVHTIVDIRLANKDIRRIKKGLRVHKMVKGQKYCIYKNGKVDEKVIRLQMKVQKLHNYLKEYKMALQRELESHRVYNAVPKQ